ncbi:hypothetical protein TWF225_005468 [Orbilia oligospora]|nr:hypothetical protein TWF225_005468 [Orbilia oligospora]
MSSVNEPEILEMWAPETSKSNHPPPAHGPWQSKALSPLIQYSPQQHLHLISRGLRPYDG